MIRKNTSLKLIEKEVLSNFFEKRVYLKNKEDLSKKDLLRGLLTGGFIIIMALFLLTSTPRGGKNPKDNPPVSGKQKYKNKQLIPVNNNKRNLIPQAYKVTQIPKRYQNRSLRLSLNNKGKGMKDNLHLNSLLNQRRIDIDRVSFCTRLNTPSIITQSYSDNASKSSSKGREQGFSVKKIQTPKNIVENITQNGEPGIQKKSFISRNTVSPPLGLNNQEDPTYKELPKNPSSDPNSLILIYSEHNSQERTTLIKEEALERFGRVGLSDNFQSRIYSSMSHSVANIKQDSSTQKQKNEEGKSNDSKIDTKARCSYRGHTSSPIQEETSLLQDESNMSSLSDTPQVYFQNIKMMESIMMIKLEKEPSEKPLYLIDNHLSLIDPNLDGASTDIKTNIKNRPLREGEMELVDNYKEQQKYLKKMGLHENSKMKITTEKIEPSSPQLVNDKDEVLLLLPTQIHSSIDNIQGTAKK
jgi:hypothetical protein